MLILIDFRALLVYYVCIALASDRLLAKLASAIQIHI
jgi:hypothetical protein